MKHLFSLRQLTAALCLAGLSLRLGAATTVDSVITSGLNEPYAVTADTDGTIYLTDGGNHRILKVPAGLTSFTVLAGQAGVTGTNGGSGALARFNLPQGIVLARGGLVVADSANHLIRFVSFSGAVSNLAGGPGVYGTNDGPAAAALFRYPAGLAADAEGNIFIADAQNTAIRKLDVNNNVTTVKRTATSVGATNMYQPAAVTVGDNGDLWIADTRRHVIRRLDTNGVMTLVAGVYNISGTNDALVATDAHFSSPRGLLWLNSTVGLLISDSGNNTIRRLYFDPVYNAYAVETFAGVAGTAGSLNGPALTSTFNGPIGLARYPVSGGFLVVDKVNNQLRRINSGAPQPPIANPVIGTVELVRNSGGVLSAHLTPIISSVFNNEVVIGILGESGTQTYYTLGVTPPSPLEDAIPQPGPGSGQTPPPFREGQGGLPQTLTPPQPDMTIKAIGTSDGRRSSETVSARFLFKTGNPSIIGDNAASFKLDGVTIGAELWYTWDGSEPTNSPLANPSVLGPVLAGDFISFNLGTNNRTFKVRAYKPNFKPSELITKMFSPSNFLANSLSFGFATGEASSDFVAAAGQRFYAPITLSLLAAQPIYSLQFNVVATNLTGPSVDANGLAFQSMLMRPIPGSKPPVYEPIPPAFYSIRTETTNIMGTNFFITNSILNSLVVPNPALNLLGVGWLERYTHTNLYDSLAQDLVKYSQAHDQLFVSSGNKVIVGGYSFVVPASAVNGSTYRIKLDRASATSDGISKDVFIDVPTRGSSNAGTINGEKTVTVASRHYLVGDVAPFRWFNAGDFGNTNLLNNDVLQVFQSASYGLNLPPPGSDFFDAMDASDGSISDNFTGNIDSIQQGDGQLNIDDIYVVFRRSVDPSLKWFERFWQNGTRQAVEVPNQAPPSASAPSAKKKSSLAPTSTPTVAVSADDLVAVAGTTVQVPVRVHITGGLPIRIALLNVTLEPLDGAPALTQSIDLVPAAGLGAPGLRSSDGLGNVSVAWLNNAAAGVSGDAVLATLTVVVPASAGPTAAYRVHINHFSCSENGLALFRTHLRDGVVTLAARNASSWNDTIPDLWRLRFFGSASSPLSAAGNDPDQDGVSNLAECRGGTHPMDATSALRLSAQPSAGGLKFSFPTGQGHTYVIEAATDLTGPWTAISTNTGDGIPREFTETSGARRFYRVKAQ